eukprot:scaffold4488_cov358-Prasinococcus_capsulatus_cf.AAC.6
MRAEAARGLHQVVVHHAQHAEPGVLAAVVLRKGEVEEGPARRRTATIRPTRAASRGSALDLRESPRRTSASCRWSNACPFYSPGCQTTLPAALTCRARRVISATRRPTSERRKRGRCLTYPQPATSRTLNILPSCGAIAQRPERGATGRGRSAAVRRCPGHCVDLVESGMLGAGRRHSERRAARGRGERRARCRAPPRACSRRRCCHGALSTTALVSGRGAPHRHHQPRPQEGGGRPVRAAAASRRCPFALARGARYGAALAADGARGTTCHASASMRHHRAGDNHHDDRANHHHPAHDHQRQRQDRRQAGTMPAAAHLSTSSRWGAQSPAVIVPGCRDT